MSEIKILHLSDLHYDSSKPKDTQIILDALWEDLENFKGIDFILFSGDLVKVGDKKDDFETAYQVFIKPLLEKTKLDESNFFIVPGNHDIQMSKIKIVIEKGMREVITDRESLNEFIDKEIESDFGSIERLDNFSEFKKRFCSGNYKSNKLFSTHIFERENVPIGIACLNSSWRATGTPNDGDRGKLLIGERQIHSALNDLQGCDIKIALFHHPLDCLTEFDQGDAERELSKEFDFIFCGHLHNSNLKLVQNFENKSVLVQGGCINKGRNYYNGYSVVSFDSQKCEGRIYLETYFDDRNAFDKAINKIPGGIMPFKIEKKEIRKPIPKPKPQKARSSKSKPLPPNSEIPQKITEIDPPLPVGKEREINKIEMMKFERKEFTNVSKILTIMGAKGGVGKSTIACRMAEMIAETGHNVFIIDLDTGAAGTTSLFRSRGVGTSNCDTVFDILTRLAENRNSISSSLPAIEVTPDYLAERKNFGRLFLLPAVSHNRSIRIPTVDLLKKISTNGIDTITDAKYIMDEIVSNVERNRVRIDCVIIDCGAEGAEFNPLVTEAHIRSTLTYIVVQPDPVCRDNLSHIAHLITQGNTSGGHDKIRVIANRLYSLQHEEATKIQFSDYTLAGCIPDNHQLFEDTQKGTINHRYGYDTFSQSVREVLSHSNDLPAEYIPDEVDLWVKPTVRAFMDGDIVSLLRGYVPKVSIIFHIILFLIGMTILGYSSMKIFPLVFPSHSSIISEKPVIENQLQDNSKKNTQPSQNKVIQDKGNERVRMQILFCFMLIFISALMILESIRFFLKWRVPFLLVLQIHSIKEKSQEPKRDLENFLLSLKQDEKKRSLIIELKEALERNKNFSLGGKYEYI